MAIFTNLLAVGYADGAIRVWNTTNGSCTLFNGHRNHITSLAFDNLGARLVSGGSDTNIVVWDLVQECGIVRLTGHRDQVTTLEFLEKQGLNHIVSGSKDSLIKIWDLTTQECVETVVSHRGEVWALASAVHNEHLMLVTGGADGQARIWNISVQILLGKYSNAIVEVVPVETKGLNSASPKTATAVTLVGPLDRQSKERIQTIKIHSSGKYIGIQVYTSDQGSR